MFALNEAANGSALKYVTYELLNRYDLVSKFKIPVSNLISFLDRIEAGYSLHDNPYHNLIHGADVTQTCHYFMLQTGLMVCSGLFRVFFFGSSAARQNEHFFASWIGIKVHSYYNTMLARELV